MSDEPLPNTFRHLSDITTTHSSLQSIQLGRSIPPSPLNKTPSQEFMPLNHKTRFTPPFPSIAIPLTQLIRRLLNIKNRPQLLPPNPLILQHPIINPRILAFNFQHRLRRDGFQHEVVVAVRAVLVALFEFLGILAKGFFAFLAGECLLDIRREERRNGRGGGEGGGVKWGTGR